MGGGVGLGGGGGACNWMIIGVKGCATSQVQGCCLSDEAGKAWLMIGS